LILLIKINTHGIRKFIFLTFILILIPIYLKGTIA